MEGCAHGEQRFILACGWLWLVGEQIWWRGAMDDDESGGGRAHWVQRSDGRELQV